MIQALLIAYWVASSIPAYLLMRGERRGSWTNGDRLTFIYLAMIGGWVITPIILVVMVGVAAAEWFNRPAKW